MSQIPLSYGSNARHVGRFPELVTTNFFAEIAPSQQLGGLAMIGRAGLEAFASVGVGPIRAVFQKAGLFNEDTLVLSGTRLYRVTAAGVPTMMSGTVSGSGRVAIDAGPDVNGVSEARIANGAGVYLFNGATVSAETFPNAAGVSDVLYIRGFWVAIRTNTQQIYSRVPADTVWTPLTFTSAEYKTDLAVGLETLGDTVLVFGETSMEPFALTGTAVNPLAPYPGSAQDVGCRNRDTIVGFNDAVFSVGNDCAVYKFTPQKTVISDNGLAERIRLTAATDLRAWGYLQDQHAFYILTLTDETWVYDDATKLWSKWASLGYNYFRAHIGAEVSGRIIAGDAINTSGQLWKVTPELLSDDDQAVERVATAFFEIREGRTVCANVTLICARGYGPESGQGSDPEVGMRYSDDEGANWSSWRFRSLGLTGKHAIKVRWNLGDAMKPPGRLFQFKVSDPTIVRISDARVNETPS